MTPDPVRVAARYKSKKKIETQDGDEATVYEYSDRQIANRNRDKAEKVEHLRKNISDLRARVKEDLKDSDPMTRMTALAVSLLDETCERVGNEGSADDGHYGVTGWEAGHVSFGKGKATIKYVGKSGVDHIKTVDDGPTVTALKELCEGRGKDEAIFDTDDAKVSADDVNDYLSEFDVTAKDIRGYRANDEMCKALRAERAKGPKDLPRARKEKDEILGEEFKRALETVAEIVGHTESILRSSYLVPGLEDAYTHDGTVLKSLKVGTKTEAQREDEATEKLVKPSPKKKPPRHDLRNERVEVEKDPDLDTTDDDLSLNFKKVASPVRVAMAVRVASRYLRAKGVKLSEDDAEAEFLKSVEGKLFKTPKSDKEDGVSYSHLKRVDPEAAKKVRADFVPKGGKKDDADKDEADKADKEKAEAEEKKRKEEAAKPSSPKEITDSVERIGKSESAKAMSEDEREGLSSLLSSVMDGQSHENNEKLEARIEDLNKGTVEKLKGGTDRKTVDALRKVPEGLYGKGVKMTTFDSKKSGDAIAKKQKAREKTKSDYDQAKNSVRDLPSEIKEAEDRITSESEDLEDEKSRLGKLEGLKDAASVRKKLIGETDSESRKKQIGDTSDNDLMKSHNSEVTKLKAKVSSRTLAIEKLKVTKAESQKKFEVADKRLSSLKGALDKETNELNEMTAYHVSREHLSSRLTDMSSLKSDSPKDRLSEAAKHLQSQPPEMRDKAIERSKARRDEKKKDLDNASSNEERAALQKEIDLADAELAAGTHDKYLRMTEKDAEKDTKASFIRSLHGSGIGAGNEHVQTLLREDTTQSETAKAVYNLADKISDEALMQVSDLGSAYETLKDYPNVMKALRGVLVGDLASDLKKDRAKKTDKSKVTPAKVKELAEAAKDLPEKDRETVQKVVRETATNLPAADRETVEDIFKLDVPTVGTPPKDEGGEGESDEKKPRKFKRKKSLMERAREFIQNMDIPPAERNKKLRGLSKMSPADIKAMMSAVMSDEEEVEGGVAKTAAFVRRAVMEPVAARVARRFLAYSLTSR